ANGLFGTKRCPEQANRMQILKPLAIQHVGLASRNMVYVLSIDQMNFDVARLQDLKKWNPVDARRLHRYRVDTTALQPVRQAMQVFSESGKRSHRFGVPVGRYSDEDFGCTNINTSGVRSHYRQGPLQFSMFPFRLRHGIVSVPEFGNEPGVQNMELSQAGSSQQKQRCASPMLWRTGLGSNSLTGSPKLSTRGKTIYTYRCRLPFCKRWYGLDRTTLRVPYCYGASRHGGSGYSLAKEGWPRHQ